MPSLLRFLLRNMIHFKGKIMNRHGLAVKKINEKDLQ